MTTPVKIAVVGVGHIGKEHARVAAGMPGCALHAVVDVSRHRAEEVAERHNTRAFVELESIIGRVDAAVVAVPTEQHSAIACRLLEAGIDCLVEKPIAASIADADAMIEAAAANHRVLQVGHVERFNPVLRAARPLITDPRFIEIHRLGSFVQRSLDIDVVLDLMIHDIDIVLSVAGGMPTEIRAVGVPVLTPRIDICNVRLEVGRVVANLTASRVYRDKVRKVRIFQPDAYISMDYRDQSGDLYRLDREEGLPSVVASRLDVVREEPFKLQLAAFVDSVRSRRVAECSGIEARNALTVALDVVRRAQA